METIGCWGNYLKIYFCKEGGSTSKKCLLIKGNENMK